MLTLQWGCEVGGSVCSFYGLGLARAIFGPPLTGDCAILVLGIPELWSYSYQNLHGDSPDHVLVMHVPSSS